MTHAPYLSIVATSRNDDHGGSLLKRMQIFINGLVEQCDRHKLPAELILVEWNPPLDRPRLAETLKFPQGEYCHIRIIEVPNVLHGKFKHSEGLPLFQMIAKNVGIRRAKAPFVLATNIDLIFSDDLMEFLASESLRIDSFYRLDRYDVDSDIPIETSVKEQLRYCESHIIRVNERNGTRNLITGDYQMIYSPVRGIPWRIQFWFFKLLRIVGWESFWQKHFYVYTKRVRLHTNACGDFTLMAKSAWMDLHGYPEFEMYSFHIDSLICYMAYHNSLKEVVLPSQMRTYHIEHTGGWTPEIDKDKTLDRRLASAGIPKLSDQELESYAVKMKRDRQPIIFNDDNWGLGDADLLEITTGKEIQYKEG